MAACDATDSFLQVGVADGRLLVKLKSVPLPCPKEGIVEQLNACLFQENSDVLIFFWF